MYVLEDRNVSLTIKISRTTSFLPFGSLGAGGLSDYAACAMDLRNAERQHAFTSVPRAADQFRKIKTGEKKPQRFSR